MKIVGSAISRTSAEYPKLLAKLVAAVLVGRDEQQALAGWLNFAR